jgi:hypothetical protein
MEDIMEKIYSARKGKFMDTKRNFYIYRLNKKIGTIHAGTKIQSKR